MGLHAVLSINKGAINEGAMNEGAIALSNCKFPNHPRRGGFCLPILFQTNTLMAKPALTRHNEKFDIPLLYLP